MSRFGDVLPWIVVSLVGDVVMFVIISVVREVKAVLFSLAGDAVSSFTIV